MGQLQSKSNNDRQVNDMTTCERVLLPTYDDVDVYASQSNYIFREPSNSNDINVTSSCSYDNQETISIRSSLEVIQNFKAAENCTTLLNDDNYDNEIFYDCSDNFDETYMTTLPVEVLTTINDLENSHVKNFASEMQLCLVQNSCPERKSEQQLEIMYADNSSFEINDAASKSYAKTEWIKYNCTAELDVDSDKGIEQCLDMTVKDYFSKVNSSLESLNQENCVRANREEISSKQHIEIKLIEDIGSVELKVGPANDASKSLNMAQQDYVRKVSNVINVESSSKEDFISSGAEQIRVKDCIEAALIEYKDSVETELDSANNVSKNLNLAERDSVREVSSVESFDQMNFISTEEIISKIDAECIGHKDAIEPKLSTTNSVKKCIEKLEQDSLIKVDSYLKSCNQQNINSAVVENSLPKQTVDGEFVEYEVCVEVELDTTNDLERSLNMVKQNSVRKENSNLQSSNSKNIIVADTEETIPKQWIKAKLKECTDSAELKVDITKHSEKCIDAAERGTIKEVSNYLESFDEEKIKSKHSAAITTNDLSENTCLSPALDNVPTLFQYPVIFLSLYVLYNLNNYLKSVLVLIFLTYNNLQSNCLNTFAMF